jgi:hypothetical protein
MTRFNFKKTAGALLFGALLIVCSLTVGCSSEKPKPVSSNNQNAIAPMPAPMVSSNLPVPATESKPAAKKVVRKRPASVNFNDKNYGVSFEYPRRYAIETGDAAGALISTSFLPMNFVQPGGVALAAVELPETSFANTDFSSAYFDVSVNKNLTAEQCGQFSVPQPKPMPADTAQAKPETSPAQASSATSTSSTPESSTSASTATPSASESQGSKLLLGDMELRGTEAVSGEGNRQSDSKYFHAYQNGVCYEFALNVTTVARQDGVMKHVDRDKVFDRLEKILVTVKINPVVAQETTVSDSSASPEKTSSDQTEATQPAPATGDAPATAASPVQQNAAQELW